MAERCAEIASAPNAWFFWRTRHATAPQVLRWCRRVDERFEVDMRENLNHYGHTPKGEQRIKLRVRLKAPAALGVSHPTDTVVP